MCFARKIEFELKANSSTENTNQHESKALRLNSDRTAAVKKTSQISSDQSSIRLHSLSTIDNLALSWQKMDGFKLIKNAFYSIWSSFFFRPAIDRNLTILIECCVIRVCMIIISGGLQKNGYNKVSVWDIITVHGLSVDKNIIIYRNWCKVCFSPLTSEWTQHQIEVDVTNCSYNFWKFQIKTRF